MTPEQHELLVQAEHSLEAAKLLHERGFHGFAASRAYYCMFYLAQAFLLDKGLTFSSHAAVIAAFGEYFSKTQIVPADLHRFLIRGMQVRHAGDYGSADSVTPEESAEQISRAKRFYGAAEQAIGRTPESE